MAEPTPLGVHFAQLAAELGDEIAIVAPDAERSWLDLNHRSNRLARALLAQGVTPGGFVSIALPNSAAFIEACIACWKVGAVPQPVSWRLPPPELAAIIDLARPGLLLGSPEISGAAKSVEALIASSKDESELPPILSPAWKAPTSGGSTGRPKLIVSGAASFADHAAGLFYRYRRGDVALVPAPLYHNGSFGCAIGALVAGARLVVTAKFDPAQTLDLIERQKVTWLYVVPTMMSRIWRLVESEQDGWDVSSLKTVWHMAAPCPPWLKQAWIDWLGAETIFELYGGTEAQAITAISGAEWLSHRGSVGRVAVGEMCILNADGQALPAGEQGEIFMRRSPGQPETYRYVGAEVRRQGAWESLGDMGWMDEAGYLYIADRRADMILVGGANIYPAEIEAALEEHPLVQSCAVVGLPDDDLGNRIHAIVQPRPGLTEAGLQAHMAERLVLQKWPRSYEFVDVSLRDDAGKVRRRQLRDERVQTP